MSKLSRISDDNYKATGNELQRNLTEEDVNILLEDYEEVSDTDDLKLGMHVRYYLIKQKKKKFEKKFRLGGTIIKIDHELKYLVLVAKNITWSVQFADAIFYKKMSCEEIKEFYELELDTKDNKINKLKKKLDDYKETQQKMIEEKALYDKEKSKIAKLAKDKAKLAEANAILINEHNQLLAAKHNAESELKKIKKLIKKSGILDK